MSSLTLHQATAILEYLALRKRYQKQLFRRRYGHKVVTDEERLMRYAEERGRSLGLVYCNEFVYCIVDLVEGQQADGSTLEFPYVRIISRRQLEGGRNVAILGMIVNPELGPVGGIVLVEQKRHATGLSHLEIPRGFAEPGISGEQNALEELQKETGFVGSEAVLLGETFTDTGLTDARVAFFQVRIHSRIAPEPEPGEDIRQVCVLPKEDLLERVRTGKMKDSFALQALSLLEIFGRTK